MLHVPQAHTGNCDFVLALQHARQECKSALSLVPRPNFSRTQRMDGRTDTQKIRPGIYCRDSCAHALAWNVMGKCATEVNRLRPRDLIWVLYTRTGTNMPTCELHNSAVTQAELQLLQHCVHSVVKSFEVVHKSEQL